MRKHLKTLREYVGHLMIGAAMFDALLSFGDTLNVLVHWAGPLVGDDSFADLMKLVEKVILYADIAFIVWWAVCSTYKAIEEMVSHE